MKKLLFFILLLSIQIPVFAVDGFSTLEERMSGKEFRETGLNKLTPGELATLNEWLRSHSVATLENARSDSDTGGSSDIAGGDMRGLPNYPDDDVRGDVISGNIEGSFEGWSGKGTLIKLTNGMIWQLDEKDSFYIEPVNSPAVSIEKGFMGRWYLSVVGHKDKVKVIRIQ